jgi:hypothetical protein
MACSCKRNTAPRNVGPALRPTSGGIVSASQAPTQFRTPATPQTGAGLTADKRKTQSLRRDAIRKALNK